jgi:hypothetical protein
MLFAETTKLGAGMILWGDDLDLRSLRDTVSELVSGSPLGGELEEFVCGFWGDLSKAIEGRRETRKIASGSEYSGVKLLWPVYLTQLGLLRWATGFHAMSRLQVADMLRLEGCTEQVLKGYDGRVGEEVWDWVRAFGGLPQGYAQQYIDEVALRFATGGAPGKQRFRLLPTLLRQLNPISDAYKQFRECLAQRAKEKGCSPAELVCMDAWPDFKW